MTTTDPGPDTGSVPATLGAALAAYAGDRSRLGDVLEALSSCRVVVPILPVPADVAAAQGTGDDHCATMGAVLIRRGDGGTGFLAFSGTDALARWNPEARPMPMSAREAAQAAVHEGAVALVLDVTGPQRVVVEGQDLVGLASGWTLATVGGQSAWIRTASE